jgi:geranylgeranylglycerol-phosphate geranylgeranyltransferase
VLPQFVRGLVGVAQLMRLRTTLSAPALTLAGGYISSNRSHFSTRTIGYAAIASLTVLAFAQVFNDICDRELDRIGKPRRPLPSGKISVTSARLLAIFLAATSIVISARAGRLTVALTIACLMLGAAYSLVLKNTVIVGNVVVALVSSATLIFAVETTGGLLAKTLAAQAMVFIYILGNEFFKTGLDVKTDGQAELKTIATTRGLRATALCIGGCALMLAGLFLGVGLIGRISQVFVYLGMVVVVLPALIATVLARPWATTVDTLRVGHIAWRTGWLPGLAALVLLR